MPVTYSVSSDGKFVHVIATEPLAKDHVFEFLDTVWQDSRVKSGHTILFDESQISEPRISTEDLQAIVAKQESKQAKRYSKLAIVAGPGSAFPRAIEYEKMVNPAQATVIVFHNEDVARKWLGVPYDDQ
jgi:hypothetical protein